MAVLWLCFNCCCWWWCLTILTAHHHVVHGFTILRPIVRGNTIMNDVRTRRRRNDSWNYRTSGIRPLHQRYRFAIQKKNRDEDMEDAENFDDLQLDWNMEDDMAEDEDVEEDDLTTRTTKINDDEEDDDEDIMMEEDDEEVEEDERGEDFEEEEDDDEEEEEDEVEDESEEEVVAVQRDNKQANRASLPKRFYNKRGLMAKNEVYVAPKVSWNEQEDGVFYELEDPNDSYDPEYVQQQLAQVQAAKTAAKLLDAPENDPFNVIDYTFSLTEEEKAQFDTTEFFRRVEERSKEILLTEEDFQGMDIEKELNNTKMSFDDIPFPILPNDPNPNPFLNITGLSDEDFRDYDETVRNFQKALDQPHWDKFSQIVEKINPRDLSNFTKVEIKKALEEMGGGPYNHTRWLLYDMNFNVSNLMLAAVKHNPEAPIFLQHWYPQLATYERYQHARDRVFDFTWEDVEAANLTELEEYYKGFGYDTIPLKAPKDTGVIDLEELDEDEVKLAAFSEWVTRVYNPGMDSVDFDDDDNFREEDNVFSEFFEEPNHPDLPEYEDVEEDMEEWYNETTGLVDTPEVRQYRDNIAHTMYFTPVEDEEFEEKFRGHLIVACSALDEDLEVAERITNRFEKEFGKAVYVETRVMNLAEPEDNVFEVWLESYEIDLLHSKRRALRDMDDWPGPAEVDDQQLDYLTERVRFLISDDAKNSFRFETEYPVQ